MLDNDRTTELFADAWTLYEDAVEQLDGGKLRNAAEKAWGATKRATDALILARTGREPQRTGQTSAGIRHLSREGEAFESLRSRFGKRISELHGDCFYDGNCEPEDVVAREVRETAGCIRDAEALAEAGHNG